jgi:hypothetical protein
MTGINADRSRGIALEGSGQGNGRARCSMWGIEPGSGSGLVGVENIGLFMEHGS